MSCSPSRSPIRRPASIGSSRHACTRGGLPEFWLSLALDRAVEVHRAPGSDGYASLTVCRPGQTVSPLAFPDVAFAVTDFFA
jgi:Uma2 family endonuclease